MKEDTAPLKFHVAAPLPRLCRRIERYVPVLRYGVGEVHLHSFTIALTPAGERVNPHQHGYYEGIWVLRGRGERVGGTGGPLRPGAWELHLPYLRHGWTAVTDVWRLGVWFDVVPELSLRDGQSVRGRRGVMEQLDALLREVQSHSGGRRERIAARVLLLLAPLLDLLEWPDQETGGAGSPAPVNRVSRLVDRLFADNLAEPLSLRDVARQMNMSVPTLTRYVREETGESVMGRLRKLRMKRAAQLLEKEDASVKEIACRVGIPEPSYFCRCFRRYFGASPQGWREKCARDEAHSS